MEGQTRLCMGDWKSSSPSLCRSMNWKLSKTNILVAHTTDTTFPPFPLPPFPFLSFSSLFLARLSSLSNLLLLQFRTVLSLDKEKSVNCRSLSPMIRNGSKLYCRAARIRSSPGPIISSIREGGREGRVDTDRMREGWR